PVRPLPRLLPAARAVAGHLRRAPPRTGRRDRARRRVDRLRPARHGPPAHHRPSARTRLRPAGGGRRGADPRDRTCRRGSAHRRHGVAAARQGRRARRALLPLPARPGRAGPGSDVHLSRRGSDLPLTPALSAPPPLSRKEPSMTTSPSRRPRSGRPRPRRNWSGAVRFTPHEVLAPTSEDEVTAALREARSRGLPLRVIGGGHSFSPLVATVGLLLTLDRYQGLVRADPATGLVTLRGGTRLWSVAELL